MKVFLLILKTAPDKFNKLSVQIQLFCIAIIYLIAFYFIQNNKMLLTITSILLLFMYVRFKNLVHAMLFVYMLLLPFQNGKGIDFLLVPAQYIYGNIPFIITPTISMSALIAVMLMYKYIRDTFIIRHNSRYKSQRSDIYLGLFVLCTCVASLISAIPLLSFLLSLQIWGYAFVYLYIRLYTLKDTVHEYFIPTTLAITAYEGIWSILQLMNKGRLGTWAENSLDPSLATSLVHIASEDAGFARMQGTFSHPNFLGYYLACMVPLILFLSVYKKITSDLRYLATAIGIVGIIGLALSGSRASWIIFFISLLSIFSNKKIRTDIYIEPVLQRVYVLCAIIFTLIITSIIIPRLSQFAVTFDVGGGAKFRLDLLADTLKIVFLNPFGIGFGIFPKVLMEQIGDFTSFPTQPHNALAQILAANGFPGILTFVGFLYYFYREHIRRKLTMSLSLIGSFTYVYFHMLIAFIALSMFYPIINEQQIFGFFWIILTLNM